MKPDLRYSTDAPNIDTHLDLTLLERVPRDHSATVPAAVLVTRPPADPTQPLAPASPPARRRRTTRAPLLARLALVAALAATTLAMAATVLAVGLGVLGEVPAPYAAGLGLGGLLVTFAAGLVAVLAGLYLPGSRR